jgi:orotate phosphoribosyltransferase
VRTGRIVLASGKISDFYVDARQTTLNSEGAALIGDLIIQRLRPEVVGIGGPVTGADPITGAVAALSWTGARPLHGFMVRKALKAHGTQNWIEGRNNLPPGSPVCMLEDTVTTGGSLLQAVERAREEGLRVVQCICVVDRQEGAAERMAAVGLTLESLVTRADLLGRPDNS